MSLILGEAFPGAPLVAGPAAPALPPAAATLNARLADVLALALAAKQAHWNVLGSGFFGVHEMLDGIHGGLGGHADAVAERVTALGGAARGTAQDAAGSSLPAYPADIRAIPDHLRALSGMLAALGAQVGRDIAGMSDDPASADVLIQLLRDLDKWRWFATSHLAP